MPPPLSFCILEKGCRVEEGRAWELDKRLAAQWKDAFEFRKGSADSKKIENRSLVSHPGEALRISNCSI